MLQGGYKGLSLVYHVCLKGVSNMFHGFSKGDLRVFVSRVFQGCFIGV